MSFSHLCFIVSSRRMPRFFATLLVICMLFGCGPGRVPESDVQQAKALAERLLDQWKSGSDPSRFATDNPPIFVSEDLWKKGAKLESFQFLDEGQMAGSNVRFKISLKCTGKDGKISERTFYYLVTTTPAMTFFREES